MFEYQLYRGGGLQNINLSNTNRCFRLLYTAAKLAKNPIFITPNQYT